MFAPTIELVNHGDGRFSTMVSSDEFYEKIEPGLPEHLRQGWGSCHVGDYRIFPENVNILEFINWCNSKGIHVRINSSVFNPKYWMNIKG